LLRESKRLVDLFGDRFVLAYQGRPQLRSKLPRRRKMVLRCWYEGRILIEIYDCSEYGDFG
jgi:hypothetical protein